jgi:hypothetical protein
MKMWETGHDVRLAPVLAKLMRDRDVWNKVEAFKNRDKNIRHFHLMVIVLQRVRVYSMYGAALIHIKLKFIIQTQGLN